MSVCYLHCPLRCPLRWPIGQRHQHGERQPPLAASTAMCRCVHASCFTPSPQRAVRTLSLCVCARACVVPKRGIRSGLPARASLLPGEEGSGGRLGPHRLSRSMVCIGGHDPGPRRSLHSGEPGSLASIGLRHGLALVRRHQAESNPSTGHRAAEAVNQRPSVRRPRPVKRIARSRFPVTTSVSPNRIGTHCLLQTTQPFCPDLHSATLMRNG